MPCNCGVNNYTNTQCVSCSCTDGVCNSINDAISTQKNMEPSSRAGFTFHYEFGCPEYGIGKIKKCDTC